MANGWPTPYPDTAIQAGWLKAPQGYQSPFVPSNDPRQSNINSRARLNSVGIQAPYEPPKTALFWRVLDLLEHPRYAVVGAVKGLTQPGEQGLAGSLKNALSNAWGGLTGKQEHSVTDIMKSYGVKNKLALALGGFVGNVALDPLTYISPFKALNKAGVQAAKAPGLASDVAQFTGKAAPAMISKDIITDISKQAIAGADDVVKGAVQTGKAASTLYTKMAGSLGLAGDASTAQRIADALGTVPVRGPRVSGADLFNKIIDPLATAAERANLTTKIGAMTPKARAYASVLFDQFGSAVKTIDYIDGATRFTKSAGKNWLKTLGPTKQLAEEAAERVTRITLANGIAENFAEESGRRWLTFMGKPLAETTVVSKALGGVGAAAYKSAPKPVKTTVDLVRRLFKGTGWSYAWELEDVMVPGAAQAAKGLGSTVLPDATRQALTGLSQQTMKHSRGLEIAKSLIDDVRRLGGSCPQNSALAALDTLGPRVFGDSRLSEALVHYMDNMAVSLDPKLIQADGGAAARAWAKAQATLTPGEQALIKKVSGNVKMTMDSLESIEKMLGSTYTAKAVYMPRAYVLTGTQDDAMRKVATVIGSTPQKQVAGALSMVNPHDFSRSIPSVAWALEHPDEMAKAGVKIIPDARMAIANRITDNWRLEYNALLSDSLSDLSSAGLASAVERDGFIKAKNYVLAGQEKELWLHPEVANMVQNMRNIFTTDMGLASFMDYTDAVTRQIKILQTTLNPSFHMRNLIGEGIMNFTAGVGVEAHQKAMQALTSYMDRGNVLQVGGQNVQARDLVRMFSSQGLGFSSTRSRTVEQIVDIVNDMTRSGVSINPVDMGRRFSDFTDTYFRMAHFIEGLERGLTPQGAAEWVRKFHVDYGDLTMFERNVMRRLFPYYCLEETAEAFTRHGWKKHNEVQVGEEILTYNVKTSAVEWKPVLNVFAAPYDGQMVKLHSKGLRTLCTPDHKWIAEYNGKESLKEAWALRTNHRLVINGEYTQPVDYDIPDDVLWAIGWIVTDGATRAKGTSYEYVIYQSEKKYASLIRDRLSKYGMSEYRDNTTGVIHFRVTGEFRKAVCQHYKAKEDLLGLIPKLSNRQLDLLYDVMVKAEGSVAHPEYEAPTVHFAQNPGAVSDAFQMLCYLQGRRATGNSRGVYVSGRGLKHLGVKDIKRSMTNYTGVVWCPHTENDTWVARDNGRVFATGNTFTRKNIPMQLGALIENPGIFSGVANLVESAQGAIGNPTASKFLESNLAVPIYDDGNGHVMYLNWNLPMADLNRFQTSYADTFREFAGMLHPALRSGIELMVNKSLTTGATIRKAGDPWTVTAKYLVDQLGAPGMIRKAIEGPEQAQTPGLQTPRQIPGLSSILPIKSKAQMASAREYEMKEILNEITQRAKKQGIYVPTTSELQKMTWGR